MTTRMLLRILVVYVAANLGTAMASGASGLGSRINLVQPRVRNKVQAVRTSQQEDQHTEGALRAGGGARGLWGGGKVRYCTFFRRSSGIKTHEAPASSRKLDTGAPRRAAPPSHQKISRGLPSAIDSLHSSHVTNRSTTLR